MMLKYKKRKVRKFVKKNDSRIIRKCTDKLKN